jgi:hypothetical protein
MCSFKKKKASEAVKKDREQISINERSFETLIVLAKENADFAVSLRTTREKIKYLTPSADKKVTDYEKKIHNLIDDLKIVLTKTNGEELPAKAKSLLDQINLAIAERNAIV